MGLGLVVLEKEGRFGHIVFKMEIAIWGALFSVQVLGKQPDGN